MRLLRKDFQLLLRRHWQAELLWKKLSFFTIHYIYNYKEGDNIIEGLLFVNLEPKPIVAKFLPESSISKNKSETNKNSTISKNNITKNNSNYTNNIINQTKPLLDKPINKIDTNYIFYLKIIIPIIIVFLLIIIIYYYIKKRIKSKMQTNNDNISQNNHLNNSGDSGVKQHYNRILNTSGNANNIGETPNNLSEIKVENIKKEIDEIVNTPGSSSGRRKRGKKIPDKNNNSGLDEKQDQMQNEIKEQIKQYVIDEHNNI